MEKNHWSEALGRFLWLFYHLYLIFASNLNPSTIHVGSTQR